MTPDGEFEKQLGQPLLALDGPAAGEQHGGAAKQHHRAERRDERVDAKLGDDEAVDPADPRPDRDSGQATPNKMLVSTITHAATQPENATTEPTDRSNPPQMIT